MSTRRNLLGTATLFTVSCALPAAASAEEPVRLSLSALSASTANTIAVAAYADCLDKGYQVAVAVVGRDGRLLAFVRSPLAGPHTIDVATGKAYTANSFQASTTALMDRDFMRDIPGVLLIGGGLPIQAGGVHYGAVGVSGAPANKTPGDVDEGCAAAGIGSVRDDLEMAGG